MCAATPCSCGMADATSSEVLLQARVPCRSRCANCACCSSAGRQGPSAARRSPGCNRTDGYAVRARGAVASAGARAAQLRLYAGENVRRAARDRPSHCVTKSPAAHAPAAASGREFARAGRAYSAEPLKPPSSLQATRAHNASQTTLQYPMTITSRPSTVSTPLCRTSPMPLFWNRYRSADNRALTGMPRVVHQMQPTRETRAPRFRGWA